MALIRLLAPVAGHLADGIPAPAVREPVEVPDAVAELWCDGERAEYVEPALDAAAQVEAVHVEARAYLAAVEAQAAQRITELEAQVAQLQATKTASKARKPAESQTGA
jgi:hypothetical protein